MTTVLLVCEGDCNPGAVVLDDAVAEFRRSPFGRVTLGDGKAPRLPAELAEGLAALQHTRHTAGSGNRATCQACGCERRWVS